MKIVIPMAGRGTRLRPHTLTIPKPLVPIAGKAIVQRLVEDLAISVGEKVSDIGFIIGDFGAEVEADLLAMAKSIGAQGHIFYQREQLGTAHAVLCAAPLLDGPVVVAFADTLFDADFKLDANADGVIWVQRVKDPSAYGVVTLNSEGVVSKFVEKPKEFVSDLAIIGIYYFKDGDRLRKECQYLIDNNIRVKTEYQLTDALDNMKSAGMRFVPGEIKEWLDFGNKDAVVESSASVLKFMLRKNSLLRHASAQLINSVVIEPCFLAEGVVVENSVIGPNVILETKAHVKNSIIADSIVLDNAKLANVNCKNSMIGRFTEVNKQAEIFSLGDYSTLL